MVLMAIDHARYFIAKEHPGEFWGISLPQYESTISFLTRFVTHFCAPGFFFLMGAGIVLFATSRSSRGWSTARIRQWLITRGGLLIALQLFIENPTWLLGTLRGEPLAPTPPGQGASVLFHFGVLYALGACMVISSLFIKLRSRMLGALAILAILVTPLFTPASDLAGVAFSPFLRLLIIAGRTGIMQVYYPLIPWLAPTLMGMIYGQGCLRTDREIYGKGAIIGASFLILFFLIRLQGGFGNLHPPSNLGWIALLNVTKYPPSLAFLLLTLGVNLVLLWMLAKIGEKKGSSRLVVFGQAALFFYIIHLYLYSLLSLVIGRATSLGFMYGLWAISILCLYPVCNWYREFKQRKDVGSLWRLL